MPMRLQPFHSHRQSNTTEWVKSLPAVPFVLNQIARRSSSTVNSSILAFALMPAANIFLASIFNLPNVLLHCLQLGARQKFGPRFLSRSFLSEFRWENRRKLTTICTPRIC